ARPDTVFPVFLPVLRAIQLMTTRRQFLSRAPVGVAAALVASRSVADAAGISSHPDAHALSSPSPPLIASVPADAPVLHWIPRHDELVYSFGGAAPRQRIGPGTRIVTWTEDCFDGTVRTAADLPSKVMPPGHDNPQTGPFFVEGAEPGDTIAVHILKLEPARDYGVSSFDPEFGALVGTNQTAMLAPDFQETTWRYDVDAKRSIARTSTSDGRHSWEVPLAPFLGCLGVAPAGGEVRTSIVPGNFGGNMDCPEVRPGNTVFFGVNMPGALLSFGDGHYAMGEGEIMGAAIEGALNVDVYVELLKHQSTPVPRIENADEIMFVGSGRPLEDAARVGFKAMVEWVQHESDLAQLDAYQFVSQNSRASIIQIVDPEYTVLVSVAKNRLPARKV
ncbi:MAG: acetamidase/formamidase family protein, partial [Gemmatimonadota bacterium]|nr:acetamidase/formamidase family protein [Gemmatimonadota bacterium]